MAEYGLLIDYEYCTGCETCVVACKEEHGFPVGKWGIRVLDDGPWQKDDSGEGGNCFNWNKIPVPTDLCDLCAGGVLHEVRPRRGAGRRVGGQAQAGALGALRLGRYGRRRRRMLRVASAGTGARNPCATAAPCATGAGAPTR